MRSSKFEIDRLTNEQIEKPTNYGPYFPSWPSIGSMGLASIHHINDFYAITEHILCDRPPLAAARFYFKSHRSLSASSLSFAAAFVADGEQDTGQCHRSQSVAPELSESVDSHSLQVIEALVYRYSRIGFECQSRHPPKIRRSCPAAPSY